MILIVLLRNNEILLQFILISFFLLKTAMLKGSVSLGRLDYLKSFYWKYLVKKFNL